MALKLENPTHTDLTHLFNNYLIIRAESFSKKLADTSF